jgi:hypothetical protein
MKAAELYARTLEGYLSLLPLMKGSLSGYCNSHNVNYHGLCAWMRENAITVPKSKQPVELALPDSSFLLLTILSPRPPDRHPSSPSSAGLLKSVQITCPNGMRVSIRETSVKDLIGLIDNLNPR